MLGLGGPLLVVLGLLTALAGTGWLYVRHLLAESGRQEAVIQQLEDANAATMRAAARLRAERDRADAALADARRRSADIARQTADTRRRLSDALQTVPEWAAAAVPPLVAGLLADGGGDPSGGRAGAAPGSPADGAPGAGVSAGPER